MFVLASMTAFWSQAVVSQFVATVTGIEPPITNPKNLGAARNFNLAFEESQGELFKWAAADDLLRETFLERCVEALDRDPGVVLAYPQALIIDDINDSGATINHIKQH